MLNHAEAPTIRRDYVRLALLGISMGLGDTVVAAEQERKEEGPAITQNSSSTQTQINTLETMTVTSASASGYAVDPVHAPASISVIGRDELTSRSYRDVSQALQDIPGVYVDTAPTGKGGTGEVSIRGFDADYTLILVDGVPQDSSQAYYNGYGGGAEYSWLPPITAIERIEVIRGPMSTLYGSDALGGVINIITRDVPQKWAGSMTVDTIVQERSDSGDRQQGSFYVAGPLIEDRLGAKITGSRLNRNEDNIEGGYAGYDREVLDAELAWTPNEANTLRFEAGYGNQHTTADSERSFSRSGDADFRAQRRHQMLTHELDWGGGINTRSFVKRVELQQNDSTYTSTYQRTTAKSTTAMSLGDHLLTAGVEFRNQKNENPDRGLGRQSLERWDGALFIEDEWFISRDFSLTTGARWVKDENYGSEFVPRLYGVYDATSALTFKGGVSAGYRTPDLKEGDSNWIEGGGGPGCADCRDVGNSDLQPEKSVTYELGAYWQAARNLATSLTVFHTDFDDKIEKPIVCDTREGVDASCNYLGQEYAALYQYTNVDKATLQGVEWTADWAITPGLDLKSSYTLTDSEQRSGDNAGLPLNDQPRHRASLGLDWQASRDTNLWTNIRYRGEAEQVASRSGLSEAWPSYTLVDSGFSHQLRQQLELYGGIYNLFDRDINEENYGRLLDGRRYNVGMTLTF